MKANAQRRKSLRLKDFDYSSGGAYFITLVTHHRQMIFSQIENNLVRLSTIGKIVQASWLETERIRLHVTLDQFVIMPNHFHALLFLHNNGIDTTGRRGDLQVAPTSPGIAPGPRPASLGAVVAGFKSSVTKQVNVMRGNSGISVWQRNYHEHVVRNQRDLNALREYILLNPQNWTMDEENIKKMEKVR